MTKKIVKTSTINGDTVSEINDRWGVTDYCIVSMGKHKIGIGSCTDTVLLDELFKEGKAQTIVTSPPYADRRGYDAKSGFKPLDAPNWVTWMCDVCNILINYLKEDGSMFINARAHAVGGERSTYIYRWVVRMDDSTEWLLIDDLIWAKSAVLPGKYTQRLKNAYEHIFHFSKNKKFKWRAEAVSRRGVSFTAPQKVNMWDMNKRGCKFKNNAEKKESWLLRNNVIGFKHGKKRPEILRGHPAVFPLSLPAFFARLTLDAGDVLFDPFSGSGTTLVAADSCSMRGYGVELSKKYALPIISYFSDKGYAVSVHKLKI